MAIKRYKQEQIVTLLRQIEVEVANGKTTPQACKEAEITIQTYYRWRNEYGGLKLDQAKRQKELERENSKVKRLVASVAGEVGSQGCSRGKLLSPERRRCAVEHAREEYRLSERHACRPLGQSRGKQHYLPLQRTDEGTLTRAIVSLAR
jgi:putative transposase